MTAATRKPHKHAEVIKAWADGRAVQFCCDGDWRDRPNPVFYVDHPAGSWRVKPERAYPVTQMSGDQIDAAYNASAADRPLRALANAALRHACDADQIVPMPEVQEIARELNKSMHAKRERDIAEAVYLACHEAVARHSGAAAHHLRQGVDIDKIIAGVRP